MQNIRIGYGSDIHRFAPYRNLYLCGCRIPCQHGGLLGHSDADAPIHAVIDALIGALALGDIGKYFPDTDPQFKDATGEYLLTHILQEPQFRDWELVNVDMTIIAQEPRLAPFLPDMCANLARILGVDVSQVSVKAKTNEGLDSVGKTEAIEARCVLLLQKKEV